MKLFLAITLLLSTLIGLLSYAGWAVTCPYCHNSDNNVKGNCVLKQRGGTCTEDYYPVHHNVSTCRWCGGKGWMSRFSAWMD